MHHDQVMLSRLVIQISICISLTLVSVVARAETQTAARAETQTAVFAGGCFWCMEPPFESLKGVKAVVSGYTGGKLDQPTYEQVSKGDTGHYEVVRVEFDPKLVSYQELLRVFWRQIDPFDARGQFCDKGPQYRAAIFYLNDEQKKQAEQSLRETEKTFKEKKIVTEVLSAGRFYDAEAYHQDYYKKNPIRYKYYRSRCGRDDRLKEVWGSASK